MEFTSDFKELVRSRTEIVSLIGESTTLIPERGGAEYKCLCPFHEDRNPSMRVYPERQSFRCWVCDEGGDVFSWVMKREALSFPETLRFLAERAHLEMPEQSQQQSQQFAKKEELHAVLKWAEIQFHECYLKSSEAKDARDYIAGRGFNQQTVDDFRLGYHPEDWDWLQRKAKPQFSIEALEQSQLIRKQDNRPGYSDYFVDRVLFPIHDERRRTVAFGGRLIPGHKERGGKYFNSKESPVFQKSRVLYGLPYARDGIRDSKTVLVVEGYADCVACHQFGVRNVVATLGTALTEFHCTRLKAFAPKVIMVYDGDKAGLNAAAKSVGMLIGQSVDLRVLTLPEGADPDDFLRKNGTEAFQTMVDNAPEAWEFRFNYEVRKHGLDSINSRETVVTEMLQLLAGSSDLQGTTREDFILSRLAPRLQLAESAIRNQLQRLRSGIRLPKFQSRPVQNEVPAELQEERIEFHRRPLSKNDRMECELLEILFTEPELTEQTRLEVGVDDFLNPHLHALLQVFYDVVELGEIPSFKRVTLEIERNELKGLAVWLADQAREKGIEQKLREDTDGSASTLLRQNLDTLKWRREELSHKADSQKQAMSGGDSEVSMLQRAMAFSQKKQQFIARER